MLWDPVGKRLLPMRNQKKWDKAAEHWMHLYEKSSSPKAKAKAASNLALGNEMKTNLDEAYEWAKNRTNYLRKAKARTARILNC